MRRLCQIITFARFQEVGTPKKPEENKSLSPNTLILLQITKDEILHYNNKSRLVKG